MAKVRCTGSSTQAFETWLAGQSGSIDNRIAGPRVTTLEVSGVTDAVIKTWCSANPEWSYEPSVAPVQKIGPTVREAMKAKGR